MVDIYLEAGYMWLIGFVAVVLAVIFGIAIGILVADRTGNDDMGGVVGLLAAIVGFFAFGLLLLWLFNSPANAPNTEPVLGLLTGF